MDKINITVEINSSTLRLAVFWFQKVLVRYPLREVSVIIFFLNCYFFFLKKLTLTLSLFYMGILSQ